MRNTRNTRKTYVHFRSLSCFRFFSQSYILSRKDAENAEYAKNICPFSQPFALSLFFAIIYLSRKDAENAKYAKNIYHFSQPFALSHFFAILYFIAKGRGKCEIRGNHMSIFEAFRSFAFFRNPLFYRERTRKTRNTRKPYITFRSLSRFRIISQSYILSRKDAENAKYAEIICHFSQPFALSLFFAILYFIAKERGKCGIRENLGIYWGQQSSII